MIKPLCALHTGLLVSLLLTVTSVLGQGTLEPLLITFDGLPEQPPGTGRLVQLYDESGMQFTPNGLGDSFVRSGGGISFYPENGTAYLQAGLGSTLMFSFTNGSFFDLVSVDLAEYSTVVPDARTVPFIGYRPDGSIVSTSFTTDGIIDGTGPVADFQTFYFGPEFSGLSRVEIPTYGWSLDNLFVSVPEPSSFALLLAGGVMVCALRRRRGSK
jgi:hypothetical protein